ncbi:MAG: GNAT family N-acetyltransferase [Ruminococcaceae bacterium]|nr:GNAT family N-acetyltransferase [Oscillospiraceae bacterium]
MNDTNFNADINIGLPEPSQIPELKALWQEAFGDSAIYIDSFFKTAFSHKRCRCATLGGELVSALYWFDCSYGGGRVAYLYAVATAKAYRGRGFCRILMEDTHAYLKKLGYACSVLVPGDEGLFNFYASLGYKTFGKVKNFHAASKEKSVKIRRINAEEYTQQRRSFLPVGAVIQENENISFLETQFSFYTGDDFLLAVRVDNGKLFCAELLGNADKAPEILTSLGCKTGVFRTPGADTLFAMYCPTSDTFKEPPTYFGLAFD